MWLVGHWHATCVGRFLLALLVLLQVLFCVHQHRHSCAQPSMPHSAVLVQKIGLNGNGVVASYWKCEQKLSMEVILLNLLCSLKDT